MDAWKSSQQELQKQNLGVPTFVDFHICDRLPLIHRHEPSIIPSSTTKINDKLLLVSTESCQYRIEEFL